MEIIFKKVKRTCCILEMQDGEVGVIVKANTYDQIGVIIQCEVRLARGVTRKYINFNTTWVHSYSGMHNAYPNVIMVDVFDKGTTIEF